MGTHQPVRSRLFLEGCKVDEDEEEKEVIKIEDDGFVRRRGRCYQDRRDRLWRWQFPRLGIYILSRLEETKLLFLSLSSLLWQGKAGPFRHL